MLDGNLYFKKGAYNLLAKPLQRLYDFTTFKT